MWSCTVWYNTILRTILRLSARLKLHVCWCTHWAQRRWSDSRCPVWTTCFFLGCQSSLRLPNRGWWLRRELLFHSLHPLWTAQCNGPSSPSRRPLHCLRDKHLQRLLLRLFHFLPSGAERCRGGVWGFLFRCTGTPNPFFSSSVRQQSLILDVYSAQHRLKQHWIQSHQQT